MATSSLAALLLADARLPAAGHTQSAGLEPALIGGMSEGRIEEYIHHRLSTVTRVEAAVAVLAWRRWDEGTRPTRLAAEWAARTPAPALRAASRAQGRALLRLASRLWPDHPSIRGCHGAGYPRPIVLGAVASVLRMDAVQVATVVAYDDVQAVAAAALKLVPLDPAVATSWVVDAFPAITGLVAETAGVLEETAVPTTSAPQFEAWAQAHAVASRRLFSA